MLYRKSISLDSHETGLQGNTAVQSRTTGKKISEYMKHTERKTFSTMKN